MIRIRTSAAPAHRVTILSTSPKADNALFMKNKTLSIGELAKHANVTTSLLRYYEKEGLLEPAGRTDSGYRFYSQDSIRHLRFIRKAQRYGFSLGDIKLMRGAAHDPGRSRHDIREIAEQRFIEIERRITEMLVLRHELELFLDDVAHQIDETAGAEVGNKYRELIEQVGGHEHHGKRDSLKSLTARLSCNLARAEWDSLFAELRDRHLHIWAEGDGYAVLFTDSDPEILKALDKLASSETGCEAHAMPDVQEAEEGGILFRVRGENAFLFAQLFLALEGGEAN